MHKVHVYILCFNEEKMLPFTLDCYSSFCAKIFVLDNMSTDHSLEICSMYSKVQVI